MAKKASRPGRTLIVFALVMLAMYGGLALTNTWKPKLGLDLQGGTRITLEASHRDRRGDHPGEARRGRRDHRQPGQRLRRRGVRGLHPGRPQHHHRDPGPEREDDRRHASSRPPSCGSGSSPASGAGHAAAAEPSPDALARRRTATGGEAPTASGGEGGKGDQASRTTPAAPAGRRAVSEGLVRADETAAGAGDAAATGQPTASTAAAAAAGSGRRARRRTDRRVVGRGDARLDAQPRPGRRRRSSRGSPAARTRSDNPAKPLWPATTRATSTSSSPAIIEGTQLDDAGVRHPAERRAVRRQPRLQRRGDRHLRRRHPGHRRHPASSSRSCWTARCSPPRSVTSPITDGNAQISGNFTADDRASRWPTA